MSVDNVVLEKVFEKCREFNVKCELMPEEFTRALANMVEKHMDWEVDVILQVISLLVMDLSHCLRELRYCGGEWEPESWGHVASPIPQVPLGDL